MEQTRAGNAVVDRAIQSGHWSSDDMAEFGAATNALDAEIRVQMLARISAAMNADQVKFDRH